MWPNTPLLRTVAEYQSEVDMEREFIGLFSEQGYEYLAIHSEAGFVDNLRRQQELLNEMTFSERYAPERVTLQRETKTKGILL